MDTSNLSLTELEGIIRDPSMGLTDMPLLAQIYLGRMAKELFTMKAPKFIYEERERELHALPGRQYQHMQKKLYG